MNNQPMKRRNPFDRPINNIEKEEEKVIEPIVEEETDSTCQRFSNWKS